MGNLCGAGGVLLSPLEQQVVSLDLAIRLRELGVKPESLWYWLEFGQQQSMQPTEWSDKPVLRLHSMAASDFG